VTPPDCMMPEGCEPWDVWVKTCGQPTVWCGFDWPEIVTTYVVLPQPSRLDHSDAADQLRYLIEAIDAGSLKMDSPEIDLGNGTEPFPWHQEWLYRARASLAALEPKP
jgi:hypothetical protein